jgi:hypothetical protein
LQTDSPIKPEKNGPQNAAEAVFFCGGKLFNPEKLISVGRQGDEESVEA